MATIFGEPPSLDLSVCDFILWGYLNGRVFGTRSTDLHNLTLKFSEEKMPYHLSRPRDGKCLWPNVDGRYSMERSNALDERKQLFFVSCYFK